MKFEPISLQGSGGGGGGSYRNNPDNLRSEDTLEALIGITSGPIRGLAPGGLKNLFMNGIPFVDDTGNLTFSDFTAKLWTGDPATIQPVTLNLGSSSGPTTVNLGLTNNNAGSPGPWVTSGVITPGVNFIDLRFIVQALYRQTKNGVGDLTANIEVELLPSGSSTWVNPMYDISAPPYNEDGFDLNPGERMYLAQSRWQAESEWYAPNRGAVTVRGKTSSPYVKELRVWVPNTGAYANKTWQVRCRLREIDYLVSGTDGENEDRRTITWESIAGISTAPIGDNESWRGLSYLHLFGKATDQLNGIPEVTGIYDLIMRQVPPSTVWDPETRVYTGATWDGATTQLAWTQCPAFQIKGLIEDSLSGISAFVPGSTLNKWDTLEASKWFAEQVPDGVGGTHPRFSANWFLEDGMRADELVNYLAGAVGGFCWDEGDGRWRLKVDKPESPSMVFTKENIFGEFSYSHTDVDTRYNDFLGVFRNKDLRYKEDRVRLHDQADIDANGRKRTNIALVGCDNRQEALRRLKLRLCTTTKETRVVNFTTNRMGMLLEQFSVIAVADSDLNASTEISTTGRMVSLGAGRTQVNLRDPIRLELGIPYTVQVTVPNPDYTPETGTQPSSASWRSPTVTLTRAVTNDASARGNVYTLFLDAALPENTPEFAPIALSATGLPAMPKLYRVLLADPGDDGETVQITASEIYTPKWDEADNIDEGEVVGQVPNRIVPMPLNPVSGPVLSIKSFTSNQGTRQFLEVNWARPASLLVNGFRVTYNFNGGAPNLLAERNSSTNLDIPDPAPGLYQVSIQTVDRAGNLSLPLISEIDVTQLMLSAADITYDDGTPVENLKPATAGATRNTPRGNFSSGATYSPGDMVNWTVASGGDGAGYVRISSGDTTGVLPSDATRWMKLVDRGAAGTTGLNSMIVMLFKRGASAPPVPTSTSTYTFSTKTLTGFNGSWSLTPPAPDGTPLWVIFATASSTSDIDNSIVPGEWTTPQIQAQDGATGGAGISSATVFLYRRSATTPALPSTTSKYTFATGLLVDHNNSWTQVIPTANGQPLWVTTATAAGSGTFANILSSAWALPTVMAQDGAAGVKGDSLYSWYAYADSSDGVINFTREAPNGHTWQGVKHNNISSDESNNPADYTWSPYTGPANIGFASSSGAQASGNKLVRTAGVTGAWDQQVYSTEGFYQGAMVKWQVLQRGLDMGAVFVGLNTDPLTNPNYTSIDYGWYAEGTSTSSGNAYAMENGGYYGPWSYTANTIFSIVYDNTSARYYMDGVLKHTASVFSANQTLYLDSSLWYPGTAAKVLDFGPAGARGSDGLPGQSLYSWYAYADSSDGGINFTTLAPQGRTWQGVSHNNSSSLESNNPADYTWTPYTGPSTVGVASSSGAQMSSNKFVRTAASTGSWDQQIYSTEGFYQGALVKFKPLRRVVDGNMGSIMIGLNTDPVTDAYYGSIDYAWYLEGSSGGAGNLYTYENGGGTYIGTYSDTDVFTIHYDNNSVKYYQNGTLRRTLTPGAGLTLYMDSSILDQGARAQLLDFGPVGSIGLQGPQGNPGDPGRPAVVFQQDGTPSSPVVGDTWVTASAPRIWRRWNGTTWTQLLGNIAAYDQVSAGQIAVSQLSAISADVGLLRTAASGARMELEANQLRAYYPSGALAAIFGVWTE